MQLSIEEIKDAVSETLIKASSSFSSDQIEKYKAAIKEESNADAKWVLELILENAEAGEKQRMPLCDDTGIPHLYLEVGSDAVIPAGFFEALNDGVAKGLRLLPGRPQAVKGNDIERIEQAEGMYDDPGELKAAPIQIRTIPGKKTNITVLMMGGGPEIRSKTYRVFHKHSIETVVSEMISWAEGEISRLGCTPCVLSYGIGRTHVEATSLNLEALKEANFTKQNDIESRITSELNEKEGGAMNLGGNNSVLGTFIKVGPLRASGIRVVSLRIGCCYDPRRATISID